MKKIILSLAFLCMVSMSFSQSFMNGIGVNFMGNTNTIGGTNDFGFGVGITYSPRFNFIETNSLSVSAGIPLTVGFNISSSQTEDVYSYYDNVTAGFIINAPLLISLNMGRGSTKENKNKFGYFVGAGVGYQHGIFASDIYDPFTDTYIESYSTNTFGPAANAGVRFGIGRKSKNLELRLSYFTGLKKSEVISSLYSKRPSIFGFAVLFNF